MKVIDKNKISNSICEYIGKNFNYFVCNVDNESNLYWVDIFKRNSFQMIRRGTIKVNNKKRLAHFYMKEDYILENKYDFEKFKSMLKVMEGELKINVVLEIVTSVPDFSGE